MRPEEAFAAEQNMLKFLTHKLRTHSLNEEKIVEKVDGRDSGTESDDEVERADVEDLCNTDVTMKWNYLTDISTSRSSSSSLAESACSACSSALPAPARAPPPQPYHDLLYDHHSSEEELEVINGAPSESFGAAEALSRRRGASSPGVPAAPEKRKWGATENDENATRAASSSDDDTKTETPVRFRTSPPLEALKPRRGRARGRPLSPLAVHNACSCRAEPPRKQPLLHPPPNPDPPAVARPHSPHHEASPRKRTRHARRHRPCLDFDKMQQLRMRGVTSWRHHSGSHAGELSVFCW